jgi:putative membrane protein
MEGFLGRVLIGAVALFVISYFNLGLKIDGLVPTLIAALVLGLLNAFVRPVLGFLSLPITILTLGLFALVLNALMFLLMAKIVPGVHVNGFMGALIAWLAFSILTWLISAIVR